MDVLNLTLLAAATLVFLSVLAGVYSTRVGFSFLLVFLVAGMLAGEDGPGGVHFDDFRMSFWVGNVALAVILLDGGLRTEFSTFRTGLRPALLLATGGVVLSAAITGAAAVLLLGLDWRLGLLLGAIVGSTDAAAVFSLLKSSGVRLNERVAATLEIESGLNDPMAVYLTLALIGMVATGASFSAPDFLVALLQQFGLGALVGLAAGWALALVVSRPPFERAASDEAGEHPHDAAGGVAALLLVSGGLAVFGAAGWLGGSGFLAVYLFGLVLGNRAKPVVQRALAAMDGYAWLAQAGMFLLLGLLVTPSELLGTLWPALGVAAVLMLVARPAAVWLCLAPYRFRAREVWFISWVGLRGAVPVVLAVFPVMAGVEGARLFFHVAFVVVLSSLLLQGGTIPFAARRLGVHLPEADDEAAARRAFGDFVLDAGMPLAAIADFYGLALRPPPGAPPGQTLGEWLARSLGRAPVVGDQLRAGPACFSVRVMQGARITVVGLRIDAD
ncbi:potassium/proton antiporter [Caldimonas tepidiphila]|uniref:potassium/proton antiporter n=1 Tax=Caldimonas tepidiphila TaxID=2315841 RepID=UPI000E5A28B5|nr:potassium/proton antiporter [Caldimonas tepidiphila]